MDINLLRDTMIFEDLDDKELEKISKICYLKTYKKGEVLFFEGDIGDSMYILKKGNIKIITNSEDGREKILSIFSEGDFLGEMALIDKERRSATAEAMDNVEAYAIYKDEFIEILKNNFKITMEIMETLSTRVRALNKKVEILTFKDVYVRFAESINELKEKYGIVSKNKVIIDLHLTHKDLANMLGVTRETVTRIVGKLKKEGIIDIIDKKIHIFDEDRLMDFKES